MRASLGVADRSGRYLCSRRRGYSQSSNYRTEYRLLSNWKHLCQNKVRMILLKVKDPKYLKLQVSPTNAVSDGRSMYYHHPTERPFMSILFA